MKNGKTTAGFTLTEIIVALVVVSVLVHLSLPTFHFTIERMRAKEGEQVLLSILGAQMRYKIDHGGYATVLNDIDVEVRPARYFGTPTLNVTLSVPTGTVGLASIEHSEMGYHLILDDSGGVTCYSADSSLCPKLGY